MRIDRSLNLVLPLDGENGRMFVHSTPISRDVFELYYFSLAKAQAKIFTEGLGPLAGPRVAYLVLRDCAQESDKWDGPDGVQNGLINELVRLSNVMVPSPEGWKTISLYEAAKSKAVSDDDYGEILNILVFFTLVSWMFRSGMIPALISTMAVMWDTQTTSLNCTDFAASLPMSTKEGATTNH